MPTVEWSEVPNLSMSDGGQCYISAPPDGGQCTPIFEGIGNCKFETGACFSFGVDRPSMSTATQSAAAQSTTTQNAATQNKEHDMALPAGFPPPIQKAQKAKAVAKAAPDMSEPADDSASVAPSLPAALPAAAPAVPSVQLPGAVGVPSSGAFGELGHLPAASNISPLTIVLALVAVGGGGAAWKFYSQRSKEKHEETMARIEKGADSSAEKNEQQRQKCDAAAQTAKEKIEGLTARADATDKSVADLGETLDKKLTDIESRTEELDTRLSSMERKLPEKKPTEKKSKGASK